MSTSRPVDNRYTSNLGHAPEQVGYPLPQDQYSQQPLVHASEQVGYPHPQDQDSQQPLGFKPDQGGYSPVNQMPPYGHGQPSYAGGQPPYAGGQHPHTGGQAPYAGGQPSYVVGQQPYVGQVQNPQQPPYGGNQPGYNAYGQQLIQTQPTVPPPPPGPISEWMNRPTGAPNCPHGLEYLAQLDQLSIVQKLELTEIVSNYETKNKFSIKNTLGQKVFFAAEDSDFCTRNLCGSSRPFEMKIFDNYKNEVLHMYRPFNCNICCCCLESAEVSAPPGNIIGTIKQEFTFCSRVYALENSVGDTVLRIKAPFVPIACGGDVEFKIVSLSGEQVGKISKLWGGLSRELYTDADNFAVTFPMDLDVRMKAVLLGAVFLIDAVFFED